LRVATAQGDRVCASIDRASTGFGTTWAANRDDGSPGVVVCLARVLRARAVAVSYCHLHPVPMGLRTRTHETPSRSQRYRHGPSDCGPWGSQLVIATVPMPMLGDLCDRSSIALIHGSRRDLALRQTICIAGRLKSPPEAHAVTPTRSPRCHHGSVTSVKRFPTRDHHRIGLVAVEGLQQFIHRADPSHSKSHTRRYIRRHSFGIDVGR